MLRIALRLTYEREPIVAAFRDARDTTLIEIAATAELAAGLAEADILIASGDKYDHDAVAAMRVAARRPRLIQVTSTGTDMARALGLPRGTTLANAGSNWAPTVADHALAMMLGLARRLHLAERQRAAHRWSWSERADHVEALEDATVLCLGFGGIGREVAKRARAFGARVIAVTRRGDAEADADRAVPVSAWHEELPEADFVVVAVPLTPETRRIVGAAAFGRMKRTAFLINVARGPVVDEVALIAALAERRIAGAGLDVFEIEPLPAASPLWRFDNVILTPHFAGYGGRKTMRRLGEICRDNADRFRAGVPLKTEVDAADFPRW
jgi:phosphoglycerate dehydrogenase-like enzyme